MQSKLLIDTITVFNRKVQDHFYSDTFYDKLRTIVGDWLTDMNRTVHEQNSSSQLNASTLDKSACHSAKEPMEPRLTVVENELLRLSDKVKTLVEELDHKKSKIEEQEKEIAKQHLENAKLSAQCNQLQEQADRNIVTDIAERVNNQLHDHYANVISPVLETLSETVDINSKEIKEVKSDVEEKSKDFKAELDGQQQYGRLELLDFEGIKYRLGENTTEVIIEFLRKNLNIDVI